MKFPALSISNSIFTASTGWEFIWNLACVIFCLLSPILLSIEPSENYNSQSFLIISSAITGIYLLSKGTAKLYPILSDKNESRKKLYGKILILASGLLVGGLLALLSTQLPEKVLVLIGLIIPLVVFQESKLKNSAYAYLLSQIPQLFILSTVNFFVFGYNYSAGVFFSSLTFVLIFLLPCILHEVVKKKFPIKFLQKNLKIFIFCTPLAPSLFTILANMNILKAHYVFASLPLLAYFNFIKELNNLNTDNLVDLSLKAKALAVLQMICLVGIMLIITP